MCKPASYKLLWLVPLTILVLFGWQTDLAVNYVNHNRVGLCTVDECRVVGLGHCYQSNCIEVMMVYTLDLQGTLYHRNSVFSIQGDGICKYNNITCQ